jgi:DNA-binding response OmpR family regulator
MSVQNITAEHPQAAGNDAALPGMTRQKILIVDDDDSMRGLLRARLSPNYEIIDTSDPAQALGLALQHKPDAVFLDLMMPQFSGFELCQSLRSVSYTSRIPIFVITGEAGTKYREHCEKLGATGYFEKPVNFTELRSTLAAAIESNKVERRAHVRVRMRLGLKLRGSDVSGSMFEELTETENVSAGGFLCNCKASLAKDATVAVLLVSGGERYVGRARVARQEAPGAPWQRYGFQFKEKNLEWVLQAG